MIYLLPTLFLSSFKNLIRMIYECNSFLLEIRSLQIKLTLTFSDLISFLNLVLLRVKVGCPKSLAGIKISSTCNVCIQVDAQFYALYSDPTDVNPSHILKTCWISITKRRLFVFVYKIPLSLGPWTPEKSSWTLLGKDDSPSFKPSLWSFLCYGSFPSVLELWVFMWPPLLDFEDLESRGLFMFMFLTPQSNVILGFSWISTHLIV